MQKTVANQEFRSQSKLVGEGGQVTHDSYSSRREDFKNISSFVCDSPLKRYMRAKFQSAIFRFFFVVVAEIHMRALFFR